MGGRFAVLPGWGQSAGGTGESGVRMAAGRVRNS